MQWMDGIENGERSIVRFLQRNDDKSERKMKVNGLIFYPFHVKLIKMNDEWGNYFVEHLKSVVS